MELICIQCGYDLRAHAAEGACPECGLAVLSSMVKRNLIPSRVLLGCKILLLMLVLQTAAALACAIEGASSQLLVTINDAGKFFLEPWPLVTSILLVLGESGRRMDQAVIVVICLEIPVLCCGFFY